MKETILLLAAKDKDALGAVRCINGLEIAVNEKGIWLKGFGTIENADKKIKQLPVIKTCFKDEQNRLFSQGSLTPDDTLDITWQSLQTFIMIEVPVAAMPGQTNEQLSVSIIPSKQIRKGMALLCNLQLWKTYAETASEARLLPLKFAVSEDNNVLIIGEPLPPLPGREYWIEDKLMLPCGYDFELPLLASLIAKKLNQQRNAIVLFHPDNTWEKISETYFVQATRSAIRLTKENG